MEARLGTALVLPEPGSGATIRHLKRPALLFRNIFVMHLSGFITFLEKTAPEADLPLRAELEWLASAGIVVPFAPAFSDTFLVDPFQDAAGHFPDIIPDAFDYAGAMAQWQIRMLRISRWIGAEGVLLCSQAPRVLEPADQSKPAKEYTNVLNIVFEAFPEPDENTPWEQLVEFRSDPDSTSKVLALKRWMSKLARQDLTATEMRQEVEWLVREYQAHMRLHRMKIDTGILETIVTASGEALENIARFKFGALAKSAFSLRHRRIQLLDAERQAPGRELAYIVRARELFDANEPE
jgi:hypothetical protein